LIHRDVDYDLDFIDLGLTSSIGRAGFERLAQLMLLQTGGSLDWQSV